jgi:hypothetical protein
LIREKLEMLCRTAAVGPGVDAEHAALQLEMSSGGAEDQ